MSGGFLLDSLHGAAALIFKKYFNTDRSDQLYEVPAGTIGGQLFF